MKDGIRELMACISKSEERSQYAADHLTRINLIALIEDWEFHIDYSLVVLHLNALLEIIYKTTVYAILKRRTPYDAVA